MNLRPLVSLIIPGIGAVVLTACEPDDPAVRRELVEMRTALANTRQELDETKAALAVAKSKADRADFLEADQLAAGLRTRQGELRGAIVQALPNYRLVSVSIGQVDTPFNSASPYAAAVHFVVQSPDDSRNQGPFVVRVLGDRAGNWLLPSNREIAASVGGESPAGEGGSPASPVSSGQTAVPGDAGVHRVQWNDRPAAAAAGNENSGAAPGGGRPAADPMPGAQETRRVNW